MRYTVWTLDVWGNPEDGFNVNNRCRVGTIDVAHGASDETIWVALVDAGFAKGEFKQAEFEDFGEHSFGINEKATGRPVFQLERETP